MDFLPKPEVGCHRTGFREKCRDLVTREQCKCDRWVQVTGKDPNSTNTIEKWDCIDNMTVWALIEMSRCINGTTGSIDKFREEMAQANAQATALRDPDLIDAFREAANGHRLPPPSNHD